MEDSQLPNCSIALTGRSVLRLSSLVKELFFLLHNPNYNLIDEALTTRRRRACKRGAGFFWSVEKRRLWNDLVTKTELDAEGGGWTWGGNLSAGA